MPLTVQAALLEPLEFAPRRQLKWETYLLNVSFNMQGLLKKFLSNNKSGVMFANRLIPFIACMLLCSGCHQSAANAPMLHLTLKRDNGEESVGSYRVFRTGPVTASDDRSNGGASTSHSVTIDKIAKDGVTLTIHVSNSPEEESKKQILIPYGEEITVAVVRGTTLTARIETEK